MANKALTLQSSNEELKAYFEAVCRIVDSNADEPMATYDGYVLNGEHLLFSFSNGAAYLTEFDVLAAISIAPIDEILTTQRFKRMVDNLVPASNTSYHTLSKVIDSHLMGCRLVGRSGYYGRVAKPRGSKTYLMTDKNTGFTKIGRADDCVARERTLQSEKPTISLLAVCDNQVETELHRKYKHKRLRGEWFDLTASEIRTIIDQYGFHNWNNNREPKI